MKKALSIIMASLILAFASVLVACAKVDYTVKSSFVFSDSGIMFEFWGYGKNVDAAFDQMLLVMEEIDTQTNINRAGESDVLRINHAKQGQDVQIGYHTYQIIQQAKEYYALTSGAFNVASYPLLYLWAIDAHGYNDYKADINYQNPSNWSVPQSFSNSDISRSLPLPSYDEVLRVKEFCDLDLLEVFEVDEKYFACKQIDQLMIDLGGIAKGYAVDLCAEICKEYNITSAKIDLSGNLYFIGNYNKKSDWNVGIDYPNGGIFCAFAAKPNSTAVTSGDYQRYRIVKGQTGDIMIPHIINANSGLPYGLVYDQQTYKNKESKVVSCSVLSGGSAYADSMATAACVMGFKQAQEFFTRRQISAVMFTSDKKLAISQDIQLVFMDKYNIYKDYDQGAN